MEKIVSAIKEFFDLRTDVVVAICITSALLKWVIPIEEYGAIVRTVATVCFVLTFVYLPVRLAFYGYGRYRCKKQERELTC